MRYVLVAVVIAVVILLAGWENVYGLVRPYLSPMLRGG